MTGWSRSYIVFALGLIAFFYETSQCSKPYNAQMQAITKGKIRCMHDDRSNIYLSMIKCTEVHSLCFVFCFLFFGVWSLSSCFLKVSVRRVLWRSYEECHLVSELTPSPSKCGRQNLGGERGGGDLSPSVSP